MKGNPSLPRQSAPRGFGNDGSTPVLITSRSRGDVPPYHPWGHFIPTIVRARSSHLLYYLYPRIPPSYLNGRSSLIARCAFFTTVIFRKLRRLIAHTDDTWIFPRILTRLSTIRDYVSFTCFFDSRRYSRRKRTQSLSETRMRPLFKLLNFYHSYNK